MTYAAISPEGGHPQLEGVPGGGGAPVAWTSTAGDLFAWANSVITIAMTPRISSTTPVLLMIDISRMPMTLISVVTASNIIPSQRAFCAPVGLVGLLLAAEPPTNWNPLQIDGSTACKAMAAA